MTCFCNFTLPTFFTFSHFYRRPSPHLSAVHSAHPSTQLPWQRSPPGLSVSKVPSLLSLVSLFRWKHDLLCTILARSTRECAQIPIYLIRHLDSSLRALNLFICPQYTFIISLLDIEGNMLACFHTSTGNAYTQMKGVCGITCRRMLSPTLQQ